MTFQILLTQILENYDEYEAVEHFDLLETSGDGVLTIKELYMFLLLISAGESKEALE
jgi:hypothetical protein